MAIISIEWIHGRPYTGADQDEDRAADAAMAVLDAAGVDYRAAQAEYRRQWAAFDDESPMTGLARTWIEARDAANAALTKGWDKPGTATCALLA